MSTAVRIAGLFLGLFVSTGASTDVTNTAGGYSHTLFLQSDGSLWGMGANWAGQLGIGGVQPSIVGRPVQIAQSNVVAISAGALHSLFLKSDGSLWGMGSNGDGQLGDGTTDSVVASPRQIVAGGVVAIECGSRHSLFIKSDGSLWAMGLNGDGQLGDGTTASTNSPQQIVASSVVAVSGGASHTMFLKSDGSLWGMGFNYSGQLGDGTFDSTNRPKQVVSSNVVAVAAGGAHSLFLKSGGSLWAMGWNVNGQLGNGTYNYSGTNHPEQIVASDVTTIAAGFNHSLFLKSDGSLWGMGRNYDGELGDGTRSDTNRPKQIFPNEVLAVASGSDHTLFIKSDGSLWGIGRDDSGQLGDGFRDDSLIPEKIVPLPQPQPFLRVNFATTTGQGPQLTLKTNLQFKATCQFGGIFYLLSSTNLTRPLSQWSRVSTNFVTTRVTNNFNVTLTNVIKSGGEKQFFVLQSQ